MLEDYYLEGEQRAMGLGNRGAMAFDTNGALRADIVRAYWETGFYVFEGAVRGDEAERAGRGFRGGVGPGTGF